MKIKKWVGIVLLLLLVVIVAVVGVQQALILFYKNEYPRKYTEYVEQYADEYGLERDLVYAVIRCESRFNPDAKSHVGAIGLMQITYDTFDWARLRMNDKRDLTFDDLFGPELNIQYGCYILSLLWEEFEQQDVVMAAYHAGWGNVKKWLADEDKGGTGAGGLNIEKIPFPNTKIYVERVARARKIYSQLYNHD